MNIRLLTPRLILRPLRPEDAAAMFGYRSRPDVFRYQLWRPADEAEIREYIGRQQRLAPGEPGTWYSLAIERREGGGMIGDAGLHFPDGNPDEVEIGITLSPEFQRRGFAAEALREIFRFCFHMLAKTRITAGADPRNLASVRLLERMGMTRTAYVRACLEVRGELVDDVRYAVRKDDYLTIR